MASTAKPAYTTKQHLKERDITMKMHTFKSIFYSIFIAFTCTQAFADTEVESPAKEEEKDIIPLSERIALLTPSTTALQIGEEKLAWRELQPMLAHSIRRFAKTKDAKELEKNTRKQLQNIAKRGVLYLEAKALNIEITEEERKAFEADLEANLQNNTQGMTKEKYIANFPAESKNILKLSFADNLKIIKLDQIKFSGLKITDKELELYIKYLQAVNEGIKTHNDKRKLSIEALRKDATIETAEGFEALAREYSEGKESDWGGEVKYDFTRKELAEVNEIDSFDWKEGETTPVLETETAFRIMRVLSVTPGKDGEPETLRVAQILCGKIAKEDISDKAKLKSYMLSKKKEDAINKYTAELMKKYPVSSILFPDGLWETPKAQQPAPAKQEEKPAEQAPKAAEEKPAEQAPKATEGKTAEQAPKATEEKPAE